MTVVRPTYDGTYYLRRATVYARHAEHEPDPAIRLSLQQLSVQCRRKAADAQNAPGHATHDGPGDGRSPEREVIASR